MQKTIIIGILTLWLSFEGKGQLEVPNAQTALDLYLQNRISESFILMDTIRFSTQTECDQLEYLLLKTERYRVNNQTKRAYQYLKRREEDIRFCTPDDEYKLLLQKAYLSSEVTNINTTDSLINELNLLSNSISDTSSFGIKRLHLQAKVAKHYGRIAECRGLIARALNIQLYRNKINHPESSGFLRTIAYSYLEEGQFEKAREYYRMERRIYETNRAVFPKLIGVMYYNEANTHYEQLEFEEAIADYDSTLFYWALDPPSKTYQRYVHEALGDLHFELGKAQLASGYWTRASEIKPPKSQDKTDLLPLPDTISDQANFKQLSIAYSDALAFRKSAYGSHHTLTGECLTFVGRLNEMQKQNESALETYNEALGILIPGFNFRKGQMSLDSLNHIDRYGFDALLGMTRIYFDNYFKEDSKPYLDSAMEISKFAFEALDKVNISFEDTHTALFWSDFTYPLTEISLRILSTKNSISDSHLHAADAFKFSEASKSYMLRSILHKDKILRKGKLPVSVREREQKLTSKLHRLKGSIRMEEKRCGDAQQAKIQVWQDELVHTQQAYSTFLAEMAQDFPGQFNQLYEIPSMDTNKFLQLLSKKKMSFISFFYGEDHIYRFHAQGNEIEMKEIKITDQLKRFLDQFTLELADYQNSSNIRSTSSELYKMLLNDVNVPSENSLTIIPDGPLYYLPWEALNISELPNKMPEYLIEKHPISYVQSATLLYDYLTTPSKSCELLLSITPEYETPLRFSTNDVVPKQYNLNIREMTNSGVTKRRIIQNASKADIIHFAGHSSIDAENEMMSQLDLGKFEDSPLHSHEIFDMNLDAALVVLSSCHSGSGKYARGEGIINLSQAFQQAGSQSVIMSMWNVDDKTTSDLFSEFYTNLTSGKSKSAALREAKLKFIKSGDPLISHPYFWSSFVLFGDDDPVNIRSFEWTILLYLLGFSVVIYIGFIFVNKRLR